MFLSSTGKQVYFLWIEYLIGIFPIENIVFLHPINKQKTQVIVTHISPDHVAQIIHFEPQSVRIPSSPTIHHCDIFM